MAGAPQNDGPVARPAGTARLAHPAPAGGAADSRASPPRSAAPAMILPAGRKTNDQRLPARCRGRRPCRRRCRRPSRRSRIPSKRSAPAARAFLVSPGSMSVFASPAVPGRGRPSTDGRRTSSTGALAGMKPRSRRGSRRARRPVLPDARGAASRCGTMPPGVRRSSPRLRNGVHTQSILIGGAESARPVSVARGTATAPRCARAAG